MSSEPIILNTNLPPLAQRMRPQTLSDYMGQSELTHEGSLLSSSLEKNQPFSMILWGPPGTGKTTLAKILSRKFEAVYYELSAVSSGVAKVREILEKGKNAFEMGKRCILFIDEIHRFNKSQQDALLHAVENGSIILIGATTENPSFEVISPLLSRCRVLKLNPLTSEALAQILSRAKSEDVLLSQQIVKMDAKAESLLLSSCGGDARKMLNTFELAVSLADDKSISDENISNALQQKHVIYDKSGDYHYDVISAFIKSVRGSDPDAAIYWLAVMLEGGEKPEFIARRLIILASEDIGNAEPYALQLATSAFQAVHIIGMPESRIILGQITTYLAAVPKSNSSYQAIDNAIKHIRDNGAGSVPLHLRNAPTKLMKNEGYGKNYKYAHSFPDHFVNDNYMPENFTETPSFYNPSNQGREKFLKERLNKLWKDRF
jgi:putative ATPase